MPLPPEFIADCPYGPEGLLIDDIVSIDRDASSLTASMPTRSDFPLTREQRVSARHPHHVSGALMIHATGMVGFAHAYFILELRHADGWIGYGTHIHQARFRRMGKIGSPMLLTCKATSVRKIKSTIVARYDLRFEQDGDLVYHGDQTAMFSQLP